MRKNCFRLLSLTVLAVAVTSISAFAADASIDAKSSHDNVMISTIGTDTDKVNVTYSGAQAKKEYLIMVQSDKETPNVDNLVYIDQTTAEGDVVFTVLPKEMKDRTTYHVYLSSNAEAGITTRQEVGTFEYTSGIETTVNGDINGDGTVNTTDALWILQSLVGQKTFTAAQEQAADLNNDNTINTTDALWILQSLVGQRTL